METRASGFVVPSAHYTMPHAIHADEAPEDKQGGFARETLVRGLELEQEGKVTASVEVDSPSRFLRLVVTG